MKIIILYSKSFADYFATMVSEEYSFNTDNTITVKVRAQLYKELPAKNAERAYFEDRNQFEQTSIYHLTITPQDEWSFSSYNCQLFEEFKKRQKEKYGENKFLDKYTLNTLLQDFNKEGLIKEIFSNAFEESLAVDTIVNRLHKKKFGISSEYWSNITSLQQIADIIYNNDNVEKQYIYQCVPRNKDHTKHDILWYIKQLASLGESKYSYNDKYIISDELAKRNIIFTFIARLCDIKRSFDFLPYASLIEKYHAKS